MYLSYSEAIQELEKKNNWSEAINQLRINWQNNKKSVDSLICYGMEIWFVLVFYERLKGVEDINSQDLRVQLTDAMLFGQEYFSEDPYFNVFFGYMIYVMPYQFLNYQGDYDKEYNLGKQMILKAYQKEPTNPFFAALYHGSIKDYDAREQDCAVLMKNQTYPIQNGSEVNAYLFRILDGEKYI